MAWPAVFRALHLAHILSISFTSKKQAWHIREFSGCVVSYSKQLQYLSLCAFTYKRCVRLHFLLSLYVCAGRENVFSFPLEKQRCENEPF